MRVLTAPQAVLTALLLVNAHYGYWLTMDALLGRPVAGQVAGTQITAELVRQDRGILPADLAPAGCDVGQYATVRIPGRSVAFVAGVARIWLTPDYVHVAHVDLPVLLMLPGWPGSVADWQQAAQVVSVANRWSRTHDGAAPVMVLIDEKGARSHDTECVDGRQGNAESYLTRAVPRYIDTTLGISQDPRRWAVMGFSRRWALRRRSGHRGSGAVRPLRGPLRRHRPRFRHDGETDVDGPLRRQLRAAERAGMTVHLMITPDGHCWTFVRTSFPSCTRSSSARYRQPRPCAGRLAVPPSPRAGHRRRGTGLSGGEHPGVVGERLELERVARRVPEEHRPLFAGLARETDVGLDDENGTGGPESIARV